MASQLWWKLLAEAGVQHWTLQGGRVWSSASACGARTAREGRKSLHPFCVIRTTDADAQPRTAPARARPARQTPASNTHTGPTHTGRLMLLLVPLLPLGLRTVPAESPRAVQCHSCFQLGGERSSDAAPSASRQVAAPRLSPQHQLHWDFLVCTD